MFTETRRGPRRKRRHRKRRQTELRLVEVWGWPTPIPWNARTELPSLPRKPVYGPAAREEARQIMREAKREKINLGWYTKKNLCRVAKGSGR